MFSTVLIIDKRKELSVKYKKSIDGIKEGNVEVLIAPKLKDALVIIQTLEPELIVVSDSIEEDLSIFCQRIRTLTYNSRPIIVAISKSAETEDRIKVLENGADDFISEPVNIEEFKFRIKAHLRRDLELNLDTKTLLPNNKLVRKNLKRILNLENQSALIASLENIKNYKVAYTEVAADKLIQTFVAIIKSALSENDFLGQLDETSFIITTNKYQAEKLATFLTFAFDTVIPKFYSEQDAKRGYSLLKGERYCGMRVNFVSVLIGGIVNDLEKYSSVDALLEKLKEIKNMAKIPTGSNYAIERLQLTATDSVVDKNINRNIYINEPDEALDLLIRTSLELQGYDIQKELAETCTEQPKIIIMDSGDDLCSLEALKQLKSLRQFINTKFIVTSTVHDKSAILDAGADLYIPKPYEISDLIRWVEYFLKSE